MGNIVSFMGKEPQIESGVFIDPSCRIIGDVSLRRGSSVWPLSVLRGDSNRILIEEDAAILDQVMIEAPTKYPVVVGKRSLISHGAKLHGCIVHDGVLVGIGAIVLDGAVIGQGAIIGAGALVPPKIAIPENSLFLGLPGIVVRSLKPEEVLKTLEEVEEIRQKAGIYLKSMKES